MVASFRYIVTFSSPHTVAELKQPVAFAEAPVILSDFSSTMVEIFDIHSDTYDVNQKLIDAYLEYMVLKTFAADTGTKASEGMKLSATAEIDALWHTHVLCTENYAAFMECLNTINPFVGFM